MDETFCIEFKETDEKRHFISKGQNGQKTFGMLTRSIILVNERLEVILGIRFSWSFCRKTSTLKHNTYRDIRS